MGMKGTQVTPGEGGWLPPVKRPWSSSALGNVHTSDPSRCRFAQWKMVCYSYQLHH